MARGGQRRTHAISVEQIGFRRTAPSSLPHVALGFVSSWALGAGDAAFADELLRSRPIGGAQRDAEHLRRQLHGQYERPLSPFYRHGGRRARRKIPAAPSPTLAARHSTAVATSGWPTTRRRRWLGCRTRPASSSPRREPGPGRRAQRALIACGELHGGRSSTRSGDLWVANYAGTLVEFTPSQLVSTASPHRSSRSRCRWGTIAGGRLRQRRRSLAVATPVRRPSTNTPRPADDFGQPDSGRALSSGSLSDRSYPPSTPMATSGSPTINGSPRPSSSSRPSADRSARAARRPNVSITGADFRPRPSRLRQFRRPVGSR